MNAGVVSAVAIHPDCVTPELSRYENGAGGIRIGRLPNHGTVLYVKDLALTLVVLLALPYVVHKLLTRPGKVIDGGVALP